MKKIAIEHDTQNSTGKTTIVQKEKFTHYYDKVGLIIKKAFIKSVALYEIETDDIQSG